MRDLRIAFEEEIEVHTQDLGEETLRQNLEIVKLLR